MILVGSLLAQSSLRTVWKGRGIWVLTALRLVVIPVAVWAILLPWGLPVEVTRLRCWSPQCLPRPTPVSWLPNTPNGPSWLDRPFS